MKTIKISDNDFQLLLNILSDYADCYEARYDSIELHNDLYLKKNNDVIDIDYSNEQYINEILKEKLDNSKKDLSTLSLDEIYKEITEVNILIQNGKNSLKKYRHNLIEENKKRLTA